MKRFLIKIFGFVLILFLFVFMIDSVRLPDDYIIYKTANGSFEKIAWNLNLINNYPDRIKKSNIFFGPSLTQAGLCDSTLSANGFSSINMGVNGGCNELSLYFLKKIADHKPKSVFLNVFKLGHKKLHNMTPLLYTPIDLLDIGQSVNTSFIDYLLKRVYFVFDYLFWSANGQQNYKVIFPKFGVMYEQVRFTNKEYLEIKMNDCVDYFESARILENNNFKKSSERERESFTFSMICARRKLLYAFNNSELVYNTASQDRFYEKSIEFCKARKITVSQIYMPVIADAKIGVDFNENFYTPRRVENLCALKNYAFLDSVINWADMTHLSERGAKAFSFELLKQELLSTERYKLVKD